MWTGDPDGVRDWRKNSKGKVRGRVYGGTISGPSWQSYMNKAIKHTKGNEGFRAPGSMMGSDGGSGGGGNSGPARNPKKPSNNGGGGSSNNGGGGGGDGGGVNTIGG